MYGVNRCSRGSRNAHDHVTPSINQQIETVVDQPALDADLPPVDSQHDSCIYFCCVVVFNRSVRVVCGKQLDNSSYRLAFANLRGASQGEYVFQTDLL